MPSRLRPLLVAGLLLLQAVTVIGVVIVTGRSTEALLVDEMQQTMELAVTSLDQRTTQHLEPAVAAAALVAEQIEAELPPVDDDEGIVTTLDNVVSVTPSITGTYVGRPDGSFLLVSRDGATEEGGTRVKTIVEEDGEIVSSTTQRDAEGEEVDTTVDPDDTYDPRARPWYGMAEDSEVPVWTEPYVFFASREPGITVAQRIVDEDGVLLGVVGVDLSLRDLSEFVGQVRVSPASRAVLVDDAGVMVASGDLDQVVVDDGEGGLRRASVDELTDPVLVGGVGAVTEETDGEIDRPLVDDFDVDGRAWQVAVAPLSAEQPWIAAVAAPEDEFVNEVVDAQRRNALLAVAISLGVVVAALPALRLLSRRIERISEHASTDALTGLPNRRSFDEALAQHLAGATPSSPVCVASIDVDLFKRINDTWGHGVGDEALVAIARRLRAALRDSDVVARVGGDEFAAILGDTTLEVALDALERARHAVGDTAAHTAKGAVPISVTIGAAVATGPDETASEVLERTDLALYAAKEAGRNRVAGPAGVVEPDHLPG